MTWGIKRAIPPGMSLHYRLMEDDEPSEIMKSQHFQKFPEHIYPQTTNALWNIKEVRFHDQWLDESGF